MAESHALMGDGPGRTRQQHSNSISMLGRSAGAFLRGKARKTFATVQLRETMEPKYVLPYVKAFRPVLAVVFLLDACLAVAFAVLPKEDEFRVEKDAATQSDVGAVLDIDVMWVQNAATALSLFLGFVSFFVVVRSMPRRGTRFFILGIVKIITLLMDVPNLAFPTIERLAFVYSMMALHVIDIILLAVVMVRYDRYSPKSISDEHVTVSSKFTHAESSTALMRCEKLMELQNTRSRMMKPCRAGQTYFFCFALCVTVLFTGTFVVEFKKTVSSIGEFYPQSRMSEMNNWAAVDQYYGNATFDNKVILVVLDGFALSYARTDSVFQSFVNDPATAADSLMLDGRCELPSMSVPNWLCLITGVTPDMSGVWGNLLIPETSYDSLFRICKHYDVNRGITASPWYSNLIKSQLPLLQGDGTVAFSYAFNDPAPSADDADERRGEALLAAIRQQENPYKFFLAHFSDIDLQGHCCGTVPQYNKGNTYVRAIANKTDILTVARNAMDNDTVMVVVSDHGMLSRGGHGGADPEVMGIPVYVYKRNSGLATAADPAAPFGRTPVSIADIAPTIAALMGVPVPRESEGVFIDKVMGLTGNYTKTMYDLYRQTRERVKQYVAAINAADGLNDTEQALINSDLSATTTDTVTLRDTTAKLISVYTRQRQGVIDIMLIRNIATTVGIGIILFSIFIFIMQKYSFCDFLVIFARGEAPRHKARNARALLWASLATCVYVGLAIGLYVLMFYGYGYTIWDSTVLHYPEVVVIFLSYAVFPACVGTLVILRLYHLPFIEFPRADGPGVWAQVVRWSRCIRVIVAPSQAVYKDFAGVYIFKHYMLIFSVLGCLIMFCFAAVFTFILPDIFRINYVLSDTWSYRFRVITVMLMLIPLLLGNMLVFADGPARDVEKAGWDGVFRLKLDKDIYRERIEEEDYKILSNRLAPAYTRHYEGVAPLDVLDQFASFKGIKRDDSSLFREAVAGLSQTPNGDAEAGTADSTSLGSASDVAMDVLDEGGAQQQEEQQEQQEEEEEAAKAAEKKKKKKKSKKKSKKDDGAGAKRRVAAAAPAPAGTSSEDESEEEEELVAVPVAVGAAAGSGSDSGSGSSSSGSDSDSSAR